MRPQIDGEVTSYFEWIGAGIYRVDERSGSMHGKKFVVKEVYFGSDGGNLFLRVDFHPGYQQDLPGMQARLRVQSLDGARTSSLNIVFAHEGVSVADEELAGGPAPGSVECAFVRVLEVRAQLAAMGIAPGGGLRIQLSLWSGGLPIDAVPQQGWLEMRTTDPLELAG